MMITKEIVEAQICSFFGSSIHTSDVDGGLEVWLPISDRAGDLVSLIIDTEGGELAVTDGGQLLHALGSLTGAKAQDPVWTRVRELAHRRGLEWSDGELWTPTVMDPPKLGQAIMDVALTLRDLLNAEHGRVPPIQIRFQEEVQMFLEDHDVEFRQGEVMKGASGVPHRLDFVFQNGDLYVAQAIASELSMRRSVNIFYDLLEGAAAVTPIAFVDPENPRYSNETFQQLAYKARIFNWNDRADFLEFWSGSHR